MSNRSMIPALALALLPSLAFPAECKQEHAIYADRDGAYELTFEAVDSDAASSSYRFSMTVKNTDVKLEGFVMGSEPVDRPNGILFHNCPEGDVTGEDLAKCTVWQGVIYAGTEGKIALLPPTGSVAAAEILLPGFGPALRDSTAWGAKMASVVPWDVLTLKGCKS
jgi:hypothetical protein